MIQDYRSFSIIMTAICLAAEHHSPVRIVNKTGIALYIELVSHYNCLPIITKHNLQRNESINIKKKPEDITIDVKWGKITYNDKEWHIVETDPHKVQHAWQSIGYTKHKSCDDNNVYGIHTIVIPHHWILQDNKHTQEKKIINDKQKHISILSKTVIVGHDPKKRKTWKIYEMNLDDLAEKIPYRRTNGKIIKIVQPPIRTSSEFRRLERFSLENRNRAFFTLSKKNRRIVIDLQSHDS